MVQHVLFYDGPEAIGGEIGTLDGGDDAHDANGIGFPAGGPISSLGKKQKKKDKTLKWMGLLFSSMLLLLMLQLLLGWLARAVSLLADSGHRVTKVVLYGFNLWIEWMKLAPALGTSKSEFFSEESASNGKKLDLVGSFVSLVILLSATLFSTLEAVTKLQGPSKKASGSVDHALLACAIVSTGVSICILVMYCRWHGHGAKKRGDSNYVSLQRERLRDDGRFTRDLQGSPVLLGREALRDNGRFTRDLQGSPVLLGRETLATETLQWCPPCETPSTKKAALNQASDGVPSNLEVVALSLHMFVHPGLTCSAYIEDYLGSGNLDVEGGRACEVALADESGGQEAVGAASMMSENLNLIAAMLHLITDMLRSGTTLCIAILVQLGAIQDAEHSNAVCSLFVAWFIFVGSLALLLQVFVRLYACCKGSKDTLKSEPRKGQ